MSNQKNNKPKGRTSGQDVKTERKPRVRQQIPDGETKEQRFIRVATPRMNRAVKAIAMVGMCSSNNYGYTEEQIAKIEVALVDAIQNALARFTKQQNAEKESFTF